MDIDRDILSSYQVNEFPIRAEISMKDGALFMEIPKTGLEAYLLPLEGNRYESLDGAATLEVTVEDGKYTGMQMGMMGQTITSSKQD